MTGGDMEVLRVIRRAVEVVRSYAVSWRRRGAGHWRVEQTVTGVPLVYTYVLDPATGTYRDGDLFTGIVKVTAPFALEIDLAEM